MIHLHCTRKLLAKLPLQDNGRLQAKTSSPWAANDTPATRLSDWHANLIRLERRQCVLFVHDTTRFPVFVPALKKPDFAELDYWFADTFMNALLKTGADDKIMTAAHLALGPLVCDNNCNRSVQGTMNQMAQDLEARLWYDNTGVEDLLPYSTSAWLADRPCTAKGVKGALWPIKAMHGLLRGKETLET